MKHHYAVALGFVAGLVALLVTAQLSGLTVLGQGTGCSWTGQWKIASTGVIADGSTATLTQSGSQVTGDQSGLKLNATVSGSNLNGRWNYGSDNWPFIATIDSTCNSFTGFAGRNGDASVSPQSAPFTVNGKRSGSAPSPSASPSPRPSATPAPTNNVALTGSCTDDTNSSAVYST